MIEQNLVHVRALLASIEAVDETSALVARLEARHETRCEEATSTSGLKKKGGCQIEPPPQITNECSEKVTQYGIHRVPAVVVNGQLAGCCINQQPVSREALLAAGVGQG